MLFLELVEFWPPASRLLFSAQILKASNCYLNHFYHIWDLQLNVHYQYTHGMFFPKLAVPAVVWLLYTCMQPVRLTITVCVYFLYACMHIYAHTYTYTHWAYTVYIHVRLYKTSSQILIPNTWNFWSSLNTDTFKVSSVSTNVSASVMWNFIYGWVNTEKLHLVSAQRQEY